MYLLDTMVLSELVRPRPDPAVRSWVEAQHDESLHCSVLTLAEIAHGVARLDDSTRNEALIWWLLHDLPRRFGSRLLDVNLGVALLWGRIQGEANRSGLTLPAIDTLIAATARTHQLIVVTRNVTDLERCGVSVINPSKPSPEVTTP